MKANSHAGIVLLSVVLLAMAATATPGFDKPLETPAPGANDLGKATVAALSAWLPDQLTERGVPGAAVAVVDKNSALWEETWGFTDASESAPITPDTVFNIRSISKSVTALGVLVAVQDGLLDLDAPISEYLGDFTVNSRFDQHPENLLTLRNMLSHRAGYTHDPPPGIATDQPGYFEEYIASIPSSWLRFPVGYRFEYANRGYDLAGFIIQVRSGQSFANFMKQKVLVPIGMTNSTFDQESARLNESRAVGHDSNGHPVPVAFPEIPSAGLYASIRDMTRYLQFHLNNGVVNGKRILREDLMAQYHAIQFAASGQRTGYTLGLWREVVGSTFSLYHEGGGRGFGSHMIFYPELGFGTVMLTNREYHGLSGFEGRIVQLGPINNRLGPIPVAEPGLDNLRHIGTDDPIVKTILGRYGDSPGVVVGFRNGVLGLTMDEDRFTPITLYDDGGKLVGMYAATSEVRFLPSFGGQPGSMMFVNRVYSNHHSHYLEFNDSTADPPGPARPEWQAYLGEYDVIWEDEPGSTIKISLRNGYLYFRDGKAREIEPGLFFHYNGEALDFRTTPPTYATQEIRKR